MKRRAAPAALGSEPNDSPVGCPSKREMRRTSQPQRAVRPLQGSNTKIEIADRSMNLLCFTETRSFEKKVLCFRSGFFLQERNLHKRISREEGREKAESDLNVCIQALAL